MTTILYPAYAIVKPGKKPKSITVRCVDVPSIVASGPTLGIAAFLATKKLNKKPSGSIPAPSPYDAILSRYTQEQRFTMFWVDLVYNDERRSIRVNISIPADLLNSVDSSAGRYKRSKFIADAVREKLLRGE